MISTNYYILKITGVMPSSVETITDKIGVIIFRGIGQQFKFFLSLRFLHRKKKFHAIKRCLLRSDSNLTHSVRVHKIARKVEQSLSFQVLEGRKRLKT